MATVSREHKTATRARPSEQRRSAWSRAKESVHWHAIAAVFKRNFVSYFLNPTGYVFIAFFVVASAVFAFNTEFFRQNLANLDQLNAVFPWLLLFFVPAVTMTVWAEERKLGTDELLLTLPATDFEIAIGKYLAALGIYSVALAFSLSHVIVLGFLGSPDLGLMFSTYFGYWLMGAALLAVGMVGSMLTSNFTVAFILGGVFCAVPVAIGELGALLGGGLGRLLQNLSVPEQFRDLGEGLVTLRGVAYFLLLGGVFLYVNVVLLGRRHWRGSDRTVLWTHQAVRLASVAIAAIALFVLLARVPLRADVTAEGLHSLSDATHEVLDSLDPDRPVFIEAFLAPPHAIPADYVVTRQNLEMLLRRYDALGGQAVQLRIVEADRFSEEAERAEDEFGITAQETINPETFTAEEPFLLGAVFTSSGAQEVVPFFWRGLSIEYELTRAIRAVSAGGLGPHLDIARVDARSTGRARYYLEEAPDWSRIGPGMQVVVADCAQPTNNGTFRVRSVHADEGYLEIPNDTAVDELEESPGALRIGRRRLGIVGAQLLGGAMPPDMFHSFPQQTEPSPLVEALRYQYEVVQIDASQPIPDNLAVLVVALPWNLTADQMANVRQYVLAGRPTFVMVDPYCPGWPEAATPPPSSDISSLMNAMGVSWGAANAVWSLSDRPEAFDDDRPWVAFLDAGQGEPPFNRHDPVTAPLQHIVLLVSGYVTPSPAFEGEFTPLITVPADRAAGSFEVRSNPFTGGFTPPPPSDFRRFAARDFVVAARITRDASDAPGDAGRPLNAIVLADADMGLLDDFYTIQQSGLIGIPGMENVQFDDVRFVLNAIDALAGDTQYLELRSRRPAHRTLVAVERQVERFRERRQREEQQAEQEADQALARANEQFGEAAQEAVEDGQRTDILAAAISLSAAEQVQRRRLQREQQRIEARRERAVRDAEREMERSVRSLRTRIQFAAVGVPAIPVLAIGVFVLVLRLRNERTGVSPDRLVQ